MDDWISNLPWHIATRVIETLLRLLAARVWQDLKKLEGRYSKILRVPIVAVNKSVATITLRKIPGGVTESPAGAPAGSPKKLSAAEELFWWYVRIRVS